MTKTMKEYFRKINLKRFLEKRPKDQFMAYIRKTSRKSEEKIPLASIDIKSKIEEIYIKNIQTFIINRKNYEDQRFILYLHGGSYLSNPVIFHYRACDYLAESLNAKIIFPIYPKAELHTYKDTYRLLDMIYKKMLEKSKSQNISVIGDSAGGGLALGFSMYLRDKNMPLPKDLILYSPWLDLNCDNPKIKDYEESDYILSAWGLQKIGKIWAGCEPFKDKCEKIAHPYLSPIRGDFTSLPKISIFVGGCEIMLPDCMKLDEILRKKGIDHNFYIKKDLGHIYPLYPIKEGKDDLVLSARIINNP